jgi:hypothetical protein
MAAAIKSAKKRFDEVMMSIPKIMSWRQTGRRRPLPYAAPVGASVRWRTYPGAFLANA